ncbi:MAG: sigma-54 interaction domain-containing protein [Desulfobacterales bacterium]
MRWTRRLPVMTEVPPPPWDSREALTLVGQPLYHEFSPGRVPAVDAGPPEKNLRAIARMMMEKEILKRRNSMIDNLPGMVFRCSNDKDLTFEYVSRGSIDLLGYEPAQLVGNTAFRKLVHKEDQPGNKAVLKGISHDKPRYEMVYRMRTAANQDKWVKEEGLAIFSEEGDFIAIEGILTDITEQKRAEFELINENKLLRCSIQDRYRMGNMIGKSPAMQNVYNVLLKAAANKDANIIITGESGTGKELAARAIHDLSERSDHAFVPVNCGAIPENLLESEFFGHTKGAFSGAVMEKPGYLDLADGGTLFLDEVGEITLSLQVKLLRALDGKGYMPVGSNIVRHSNFRIVAATNQEIRTLVKSGAMRMDFFYRINVIPIRMPALREREEDIPLLIDHFLDRYGKGTEKAILPYEILVKMKQHSWPGNVRELKNAVDRYITMGELNLIEEFTPKQNVPADGRSGEVENPCPCGRKLEEAVREFEYNLIRQTLEQCRWKKGATADALGISWRTLQRKLKRHAIE